MKAAVLGCGEMGKQVLSTLSESPGLDKVLAYDVRDDALKQIGHMAHVHPETNLSNVLDDPEVKVVFITAPNGAHKDLALAALRSGKAVFLEKPIAPTLRDSEVIVAEAERLNAFLQIGFELRYSRLYRLVKDWIEQGLLGAVINTHCTYICSEFHGKTSWRNSYQTGGGMFGEKLCHYVDLPRWWIDSEVEEVYSICAPNVVPYFEIHDNYHTTCRFKSGAVSHLTFMMYPAASFDGDPLQNYVTQQMDDGHELRYLVVGKEGAAETDVFRRRLRRWKFGDSATSMTSELVESLTWSEKEDHYYFHDTTTQALDIIQRVKHGLPPMTSARDSLETMQVVEAAELSASRQRPVRIQELSLPFSGVLTGFQHSIRSEEAMAVR